jgi:hypothetical protein
MVRYYLLDSFDSTQYHIPRNIDSKPITILTSFHKGFIQCRKTDAPSYKIYKMEWQHAYQL